MNNQARNLFAPEQWKAACDRITRQNYPDWIDHFNNKLVSDVQRGRLDPNRFYPISKLTALSTAYGFQDDELVICRVSANTMKEHNPGYKLPVGFWGGCEQPVKTLLAVRMNPEKFSGLMGMYNRGKAA